MTLSTHLVLADKLGGHRCIYLSLVFVAGIPFNGYLRVHLRQVTVSRTPQSWFSIQYWAEEIAVIAGILLGSVSVAMLIEVARTLDG
jgi:hypothetical protein